MLQEDAARITDKQRKLAHIEKVIDNKIKANKKEIENLFADEKQIATKPQSKEARRKNRAF